MVVMIMEVGEDMLQRLTMVPNRLLPLNPPLPQKVGEMIMDTSIKK
jgi:hypothetical protein